MVLGQIELHVRLQVALKAGRGILARIHDEFASSTAGFDMFAAGPMTGLATRLANELGAFHVHARMRAGRKHARNVGVAIIARSIAHISCAGDFRRRDYRSRERGAGIEQKSRAGD